MFKPISVLLLFLHVLLFAAAQAPLKDFVQHAAAAVSTIEPDSTNFSDLDIIGTAIGDATMVMLGEQDHGDAPVFLAKTRLIKYLHEKKGFNILAFESDFFGLTEGWTKLQKEKDTINRFLARNIFPIWTYCHTCSHLFYGYIPATYTTAQPLAVAGFDDQMLLGYSSKNLVTQLDSVLRHLDLPIVNEANYQTVILPTIDTLRYSYVKKFQHSFPYSECAVYLKKIKQQALEKQLGENDFWMMVINNLIAENNEYQALTKDKRKSGIIRDHQMAANLQWLAEVKYPKEKIIVWAANAHIAKYADSLQDNPDAAIVAMGSYYTSDSLRLKKTYIIGFTSYEGEAGRLGFEKFTIRKPKADGFENWIDKSWEYAFVDFRNFTGTQDPFYLKGLGHNSFFKKDWTKIFDGIFYIRKIYPCIATKGG